MKSIVSRRRPRARPTSSAASSATGVVVRRRPSCARGSSGWPVPPASAGRRAARMPSASDSRISRDASMLFLIPSSRTNSRTGVNRVSMRSATFFWMKPRADSNPCRQSRCSDSSPMTETYTFAVRVSGAVSTRVTVTFCTRGSRSANRIVELTDSRIAWLSFSMRRDMRDRASKSVVPAPRRPARASSARSGERVHSSSVRCRSSIL